MTNKKKTRKYRKKAAVEPVVQAIIPLKFSDPTPTILDPRLGRRRQDDPRSLDFPIMALLQREAYRIPRSKIWECKTVLDQGNEGSCVGHGFAHELISRPYPQRRVKGPDAVKIYKAAQDIDEWPGNNYSGTSVLAGAKATMQLYPGVMESYRWANTIQDIVATLGYYGPIVIGVNWYTGCYSADSEGLIHVSGSIAGGHCVLLNGVDVAKNRFLLTNSWGEGWGTQGKAWITFEDIDRLLHEGGDFCVPVNRRYWKELK